MPVNEAIGLTFARVLRSFLRQDPDASWGETRAIWKRRRLPFGFPNRASRSSLLCTPTSPGAITRLIDMGVEPLSDFITLEAVLVNVCCAAFAATAVRLSNLMIPA